MRAFETARQVLVLACVLAASVYMSSIWPTLHLAHTRSADTVQYQVRINGPLTSETIATICDRLGSGRDIAVVNTGTATALGFGGQCRAL